MKVTEKWKDVPGYEGLYQVSSTGKIISLNHRNRGEKKELTQPRQGQIVPQPGTRYTTVSLQKGGIHKRFTVHSLVAAVFIGSRPNDYVINHKDFNSKNNHVDNLEYITQSENQFHSFEYLRKINKTSQKAGKSPMTDDAVRAILKAYHEDGHSVMEVYEMFRKESGMHPARIQGIVERKTWRYVQYPYREQSPEKASYIKYLGELSLDKLQDTDDDKLRQAAELLGYIVEFTNQS